MGQGVGGCRERNAKDNEEDVSHGQVQDQQVCRVPHLLVEAHPEDHLVEGHALKVGLKCLLPK